jgi:hypothetical protein
VVVVSVIYFVVSIASLFWFSLISRTVGIFSYSSIKLVVHHTYEDYESNFNETALKIFKYWEISVQGEINPFHKGKTYVHFFTRKERRATKKISKNSC